MEKTKSPPAIWYAVVARSQMDVRLARDLVSRGVDAFVPTIYRRQKVGSHAWPVPEKWLSPYVFVCIEEESQFAVVRNTLGFDEFLALAPPEPTRFREEIVRHAMAQTLDSLAEAESRSRPKESLYTVGQHVTVVAGPFAGHGGEIVSIIGTRLKIDPKRGIPIIAKEREVMEA